MIFEKWEFSLFDYAEFFRVAMDCSPEPGSIVDESLVVFGIEKTVMPCGIDFGLDTDIGKPTHVVIVFHFKKSAIDGGGLARLVAAF